MKIFRLEAENRGIYMIGYRNERILKAMENHYSQPRHPNINQDVLLKYIRPQSLIDYKFGFGSIKQMLAWFDGEKLKELLECGAKILALECHPHSVIMGDKQVIFLKKYLGEEPKVLKVISL